MGSIGAPELIVVAIVFLLAIAAPLAIAVWLITRSKQAQGAGLIACRRCGKAISPRAASCPQCGEPGAAPLRG